MAKFKSFLGVAGVAALASLAMSTAVLASDGEDRKFGYSITLTGTSDYIFRGISSNDQLPAFQPFIEFTYGIAYVNFQGSNIAEPLAPFEMDISAGIRPVTGPVSWDIGVLYYTYPASQAGWGATDYVEFKVGASITPVTNLTLGLTGYWTPDQGGAAGETETVEGNISYTLPKFAIFDPTLSGTLGYTNGDGPNYFLGKVDDYTYWNVGVKLAVDKYFMDFRYWDTSINDSLADSRFVFSAGVNLP
ncbi:conserved hypothetical protein [Hyphomicrobium denitrificans ATCC 51888]|uniref:MltA-interacting MipA family protein n=1 Tax=Hyphomicrobium denitrificans (strain ATCC 51888 / DSM 1869 / NCIMB 11706 / TK 0415) TaxID=582899 RepID=D8JPS3_HYPDA|nr:TorF family putative porin [Hyphomicrobium denitrificans]ADJ23807.1 conserved hypothetical protein [Hyphomicrobium denitrificans ATCC 51888]